MEAKHDLLENMFLFWFPAWWYWLHMIYICNDSSDFVIMLYIKSALRLINTYFYVHNPKFRNKNMSHSSAAFFILNLENLR